MECLESGGMGGAAILGLAAKDMVGIFPQFITGKAVAIRLIRKFVGDVRWVASHSCTWIVGCVVPW